MLRIGIIGAGHWGPNLLRIFHDRVHSEVAAVVDTDEERLARVRSSYDDIHTLPNAESLFRDPAVDVVVVATPTSTHYELTKAALDAGKHVLVEKPITTRSEEAWELCELADAGGLVLMVGHVFLYNRAIRKVKEYLDSGKLGRVYYMSMVRTNLGPIRVDVNAAWDLAAHEISIANYWLENGPQSASAIGGCWINEGNEDAVFSTLHYPDKVLVNLHVSWLNPRKARQITVVGDRMMLTFDDMNLREPIRLYDRQVTEDLTHPPFADTFASFRASVREGDITIPRVSTGEPLRIECEHFLTCVREGKRPMTDGKNGLDVVRALEAMDQSMRNGGARVRLSDGG